MIEQRTAEWKRQRLGYFTGSCIGKLMTGTKSDKSAFGDTAMSYIYSVASERNLNEKVIEDETIWQMYDEQVSVWSKAIQFGIDWEPEAKEMYAKVTGNKVTETGSVEHPTIDFLSASPDADGGKRRNGFRSGLSAGRRLFEQRTQRALSFRRISRRRPYARAVAGGESLRRDPHGKAFRAL